MSRLLSDDFGSFLRANDGRFDALLAALDKRVATTSR